MQKNKILRNEKVGIIFWIFICALLFFLLWQKNVLPTYAADGFYHSHQASCYERKLVPCTDHYRYVATATLTQHCPPCSGMRECTYYSRMEFCPSRQLYHENGGYFVCRTCGSKNPGLGNFDGYWNDAVEKDVLCCKIAEGTLEAQAVMEVINKDWCNTNTTVTLQLKKILDSYTPGKLLYSFDGGGSFQEGSSFQVTKNGTVNGVIKDDKGRTMVQSVTVANLDFGAPQIQSFLPEQELWQEGSQKLFVQASDGESGIGTAAYSFDNGATFGNENYTTVSESGTYYVIVRDMAGNTSEASLSIAKIPKQTKVEPTKPEPTKIEQTKIEPIKIEPTKIEQTNSEQHFTENNANPVIPRKTIKQEEKEANKEKQLSEKEALVNSIREKDILRDIWKRKQEREVEDLKEQLFLEEQQQIVNEMPKTDVLLETKETENLQQRYEMNQEEMVKYLELEETKEERKNNVSLFQTRGFFLFPLGLFVSSLLLFCYYMTHSGLCYGKNEQQEFVYLGRVFFHGHKIPLEVQIDFVKITKQKYGKLCLKPPKDFLKKYQGQTITVKLKQCRMTCEVKSQIFLELPL